MKGYLYIPQSFSTNIWLHLGQMYHTPGVSSAQGPGPFSQYQWGSGAWSSVTVEKQPTSCRGSDKGSTESEVERGLLDEVSNMTIKRNLNGSQKKEAWKNKAVGSSDGSSTAGTARTSREGSAGPVSK
jgi:hypothetical protein